MKRIVFSIFMFLLLFIFVGCNESKKITIKFVSSLDDFVISEIVISKDEKIEFPNHKEYENYTFVGWDKEILNLEQDEVVTALYKKNTYIATFKTNLNDEVIQSTEFEFDDNVIYPEPKEYENYTFIGWDKEILNLDQNEVITLIYKKNTYNITFKSSIDDEIIQSTVFEFDEEVIYPEPKEYENYTFVGWDKEISSLENDEVVYALYEKNTIEITYKYISGNEEKELEKVTYERDEEITPPNFNYLTYTNKKVKGFDKNLKDIDSDCIVYVTLTDIEFKESMKLSDIYWWINYINPDTLDHVTISKDLGNYTIDYNYESIEEIKAIFNFIKNLQLSKAQDQETRFGEIKYVVYFSIGDLYYSIKLSSDTYSYGNTIYDLSGNITKFIKD